MAVEKKNIINKLYFVFVFVALFLSGIFFRVINIQYAQGAKYRKLSKEITIKNDTIFPNRGNIYAADGSLLATSMSRFEIRMDAVTISKKIFNAEVSKLSKALANMFGDTSTNWLRKLKKARVNNNRYLFIARGLGYKQYLKVKNFPVFKHGVYKGGFIANQTTKREHPLGKIADRTIGYDANGSGIEGAFREQLKGEIGWRMKRKIAKGQWKPINDVNEKEPIDGKDIVTTIDINIQDIAHHSLLRQLEFYEADHGCVVVMETQTGEIKAISNLGRTKSGKYFERLNYAIGESHEPGSAFKVMSLVAALELKAIDTSTVVDTGNGKYKMHGRIINDAHRGGYGKISAAKALEVSSNIAFARLIDENFEKKPNTFINQLKKMHLNDTLGTPIIGEGKPVIPDTKHPIWSKNALPSIAYGYNLKLTPLQTLTFYNAIANNGTMVKPKFVKEIRSLNTNQVIVFDTQIIDASICSSQTVKKVQKVLKKVIEHGTAKKLYSKDFSMAGKTGTARTEYGNLKEWLKDKKYISSFTGYFPSENAKYSCIVVIHKPKVKTGFYGADVAGPVFKDIAQKIYTVSPIKDKIRDWQPKIAALNLDYQKYFKKEQQAYKKLPNTKGMSGMDAIALLENLGVKVKTNGNGKVIAQSIKEGETIQKGSTISLTLM